jgi:hypothetical protein
VGGRSRTLLYFIRLKWHAIQPSFSLVAMSSLVVELKKHVKQLQQATSAQNEGVSAHPIWETRQVGVRRVRTAGFQFDLGLFLLAY